MGKTIYLVKKDPDCKKEHVEWIQMSGKEFYQFIHSQKGRGRYFIHLTDDVSYEADEIYIEAGKSEYQEWYKEARRHRYLTDGRDGVSILPLEILMGNEGYLLLDALMEQNTAFEEECAEQDELERLGTIIRSLESEERELLEILYLNGRVYTEQEAANILGVSRDVVKRRKKKIFLKIRKKLRPES